MLRSLISPLEGIPMLIRWRIVPQTVLVLLALVLSSCNIFDPLYSDDNGDEFGKAISNAEAAMKRDDFSSAVTLYGDALRIKPTSSQAMLGLSSAIILRDIQIKDVPALMNAVFNVDPSGTNTNTFLSGLSLTNKDYKNKVLLAASNAAWYRSPVIGINRLTGQVRLGTNHLPLALPSESDGVIPATDRNATLNYLIVKSVHVALVVQDQFAVTRSLVASIDTNAMTSFDISNFKPGQEATNKQVFAAFHSSYTNKMQSLSNTYTGIVSVLTATDKNSSLVNLMGVVDGLINLLQVPDSGMSADSVARAVNAVSDIRTSLTNLSYSLTNDSSGIKQGFSALADFRERMENFARYTNIASIKTSSWMPY